MSCFIFRLSLFLAMLAPVVHGASYTQKGFGLEFGAGNQYVQSEDQAFPMVSSTVYDLAMFYANLKPPFIWQISTGLGIGPFSQELLDAEDLYFTGNFLGARGFYLPSWTSWKNAASKEHVGVILGYQYYDQKANIPEKVFLDQAKSAHLYGHYVELGGAINWFKDTQPIADRPFLNRMLQSSLLLSIIFPVTTTLKTQAGGQKNNYPAEGYRIHLGVQTTIGNG